MRFGWNKIATGVVLSTVLLVLFGSPQAAAAEAVGSRRSGLWLKLILLPFIFMYVLYRNRQLKRGRD